MVDLSFTYPSIIKIDALEIIGAMSYMQEIMGLYVGNIWRIGRLVDL
jgi:hypothetical protein